MLKINQHMKREPFGGHHYTQYAMTFRGETFKEVVEKLSEFRVTNNIAIGNPEQDVLLFYAVHWPFMVKEDTDSPVAITEPNDYVGWRDWIYEAWRRPPKKSVVTKEASQRWDICLKCPMHRSINWIKNGEAKELAKRAFMLRRGIDIPKDLGYCLLHKADLGAFVFIDGAKEFSAKLKTADELPTCWVK